MLMEQLEYNLLFRWFVDMAEPVWVSTVFSENRERLMEGEIAKKFFDQARRGELLSDEPLSVDGPLIEALASHKSFQRKDASGQTPKYDPGNPTVNFHGKKRSNDTHESATDADARLARKSGGHEANLAYCGNVKIEKRHGLAVDDEVLQCNGTAERDPALLMERLEGNERVTVAGDKGYNTRDFVKRCGGMNATPHVAQNHKRAVGSAIDGRTMRHEGYRISQQKRKRIEEIFGWKKVIGLLRKLRHRGADVVDWLFAFTAAVYNVVRINKLLASP